MSHVVVEKKSFYLPCKKNTFITLTSKTPRTLSSPPLAQFSEGVAVNARCHIDGGSRGVIIGKNTRLGPGCYIFAFNHGIDPKSDIKDQPVSSEGIVIGEDVWVRRISPICIYHQHYTVYTHTHTHIILS